MSVIAVVVVICRLRVFAAKNIQNKMENFFRVLQGCAPFFAPVRGCRFMVRMGRELNGGRKTGRAVPPAVSVYSVSVITISG